MSVLANFQFFRFCVASWGTILHEGKYACVHTYVLSFASSDVRFLSCAYANIITTRWACPVGNLNWPIHTAVPADDVTTRALTSQLMHAYDVIGGH